MNITRSIFFLFFISFIAIGFLLCFMLSGLGLNLFGTHNELSQEVINKNTDLNNIISSLSSNSSTKNTNVIIIYNNMTK